jgi:hypothetical protein
MPGLKGGVAVVELLLLLRADEAEAFEAAAHQYGLTVGQMARQFIREFLDREGRLLCQRQGGVATP